MNQFVRRALVAASAVSLLPIVVAAQEAVISGKVTSEAGAPIPAAQVYVEKMQIGTTTKDDGTYRFTVPAARVQGQLVNLTAQVIGYKQKTAAIRLAPGEITQDFSLVSVPAVLQQVVITGEGTVTTQAKLGNRIDPVKSEDIIKSNETNVTSALAAKAPNVDVRQQSGDAGGSTSIEIRGIKSFTGTGQPLFVVDGVPFDNQTLTTISSGTAGNPNLVQGTNGSTVAPNRAADINPNDIESVSILKGAAAAAIYGSRAANGVVLITTKSGKAGPTRYSLRSSYSFDDKTGVYPFQTTWGQGSGGDVLTDCTFTGTQDCTLGGQSWGPVLTHDAYIASIENHFHVDEATAETYFGRKFPSGNIVKYDHYSDLFETGHVFDNALSVAGGDDRRSFFLSAGYTGNQGYIQGDKDFYNRTTVRLKATQALSDRFRLGGNFSYVDTRGGFVQRGDNTSGIMLAGTRTPTEFDENPYIDPASGLQRSYRFPQPSPTSLFDNRIFDNPLFVINQEPSVSRLDRVFGNVDMDYSATDWLTFKYTGGADFYTDDRSEALPISSSSFPQGSVNRGTFSNFVVDQNLLGIASHTFSDKLAGSLTLGTNVNSTRFRQVFVLGQNLITPTPLVVTNTTNYSPNDFQSLIHLRSFFGQATVDLADQVHLTGALRNDASSAFAQNSNSHWYPKASVSWEANKAIGDFGGKLDFLKPRFSYGITGRAPDVYSTLTTFNNGQTQSSYDGTYFLRAFTNGTPGLVSNFQIGNNNLNPEKTTEYEGGVDIGGFHGFTDASITLYKQKSTDVIFLAPIDPASGAAFQVRNVGAIQNKGVEVTWNFHPVQSRDVAWDFGLQWARNRNNVLSIAGADEILIGNSIDTRTVARVGYPVGEFSENDFIRCRYNESDASNTINGVNVNSLCRAAGAPNQALFIDGDGSPGHPNYFGGTPDQPFVDPALRAAGNQQANWHGSIRSGLTLMKKLQLSVLVDIKNGGQNWNGTRGALNVYGRHEDTNLRDKCPCVFGPSSTAGVLGYNGIGSNVFGPGAGLPTQLDQDWWTGNGGSFAGPGAIFTENSGFTKLREVSVGYTFDQSFVRRSLGLSSIDVRVAGRNLKTWTKYRGVDPEASLNGANEAVQGVDWFNNPQARSFVLTVGLNR